MFKINNPNVRLTFVPLPKLEEDTPYEREKHMETIRQLVNDKDKDIMFYGNTLVFKNGKLVAILKDKGIVYGHQEYAGVLYNPETKIFSQNHDYVFSEIERHIMSV